MSEDGGTFTTSASGEPFTELERKIVGTVAAGRKDSDIAANLSLDESALVGHLSSISRKLNASNRLDLIIRAYHAGLVRPPAPNPRPRPGV